MKNYIDKVNELISEKNFEDAKNVLLSNILPDSDDIEALKLLGLCNVNLKCSNQAIEIFETVVKKAPDDATSWYYLGTMYDEINNIEKAENAYKKVISLREEYTLAHKNLAVMYLKHHMSEKAIPYAQKAVELDPLDYQGYYIQGTIAIAKKDFETAILNYEKALALNPEILGIYTNLGAAYFATNQLDKAANTLLKVVEIDEENATAHYHLGNIYQIQKEYNKAFKHFQNAYNSEASTLHLTALAYSALKAEKIEDAIMLYKTLCVLCPEKQNFEYNLACAYLSIKNYKEAIKIFKKLVAMNPTSSAMFEKLAEVYVALGEYNDAKAIYELLIKKGKVNPELYYNYALICRQAGDNDQAVKILQKVIELDSQNALVHKDLGVIYLSQRLFDYAQDEFETALKLAPDNMQIVFEYANYLFAISDYNGAKALYEKVTSEVKDNASCYFYQGLNYLALNDLKSAKDAFTNSVNIEKNALNIYHLARTNFYLQDYDTAYELLITLEEQDIDAENLLALTLYEKGLYKKAIEIYKNILERFNDNLNIMLSLSKCYIMDKDKENALNAINEILLRFPEHEDALELKKEAEAI